MIEKLRSKPGSYGMVNANGWFLTKHGMGLYSTEPFFGDWNQILDSSNFQNEIDKDIDKDFVEEANGQGKIETYTVVNSREGPTKGIIIGRLETGKRFIANTRRDKDLLMKMMQNEMLNVQGIVKFEDSRNIFEPS